MKKRNIIAMVMVIVLMMGSTMMVCAAESAQTFNYKAYADTYPDLKAAYGYDANALYQHYITSGKKEGRVGTFTDGSATTTQVTQPATTEQMDPLPPLERKKLAAWYGALTPPSQMSNARVVAEYERIGAWINEDFENRASDSAQVREHDLSCEVGTRAFYLRRYEDLLERLEDWPENSANTNKEINDLKNNVNYQKAISTDTTALKKYMH